MKRQKDRLAFEYETDDIEERNFTLALRNLFASLSKTDVTEDPLAIICKSLVHGIDNLNFAYYCYEGNETGVMAAVREGVDFFMPPPDVHRMLVANLRKATKTNKVAVISHDDELALLAPEMRKRWKHHAGIAVQIAAEGRPVAVMSFYMLPGFVLTDRHRTWFSLVGEAASALLTRRRALTRIHAERDVAIKARQDATLAVESTRAQLRSHLAEITKMKEGYKLGTVSLLDAILAIEASADKLYSVCNMTQDPSSGVEAVFKDKALSDWVDSGLRDPRIKAVVGLRGTNKTTILHAVRGRVLASGVDETRVVIIDFEDARFRRFKSAEDMLNYLRAFQHAEQMKYLFLDEVGMVDWHTELLKKLGKSRNWNVWVAASTSHVVAKAPGDFSVYRVWSDPKRPRSRGELEKFWCQIFMRDVVSGVNHPDIRAKEALAEYYSDHLGEMTSLRVIAHEMKVVRRKMVPASIRAYRQSLEDAYLIEFSPVYDVFAEAEVKSQPGRVFYTDLELRNWRFGSAPQKDAARLALNRFYLELRRKYGVVYTPRFGEADFVTLAPNGKPLLWKVPEI